MKLRIQATKDPEVRVTLDDKFVEEHPEPVDGLCLIVEDTSGGEYSGVRAPLNAHEARALGEAMMRWADAREALSETADKIQQGMNIGRNVASLLEQLLPKPAGIPLSSLLREHLGIPGDEAATKAYIAGLKEQERSVLRERLGEKFVAQLDPDLRALLGVKAASDEGEQEEPEEPEESTH